MIEFLWDGWRPHSAVLGRVDGVKGYHDIARYPDARRMPGLVLFRWDAPLFFANAELFQERVLEAVAASPTPVRLAHRGGRTGHQHRRHLGRHARRTGCRPATRRASSCCFAEMKDPVKDKLKRFGLFAELGERAFFPTIGSAVSAYLEAYAVEWDRDAD